MGKRKPLVSDLPTLDLGPIPDLGLTPKREETPPEMDDLETATADAVRVIETEFGAAIDAQAAAFKLATDSEYWFSIRFPAATIVVVCQSRAEKAELLRLADLDHGASDARSLGDKYLDGLQVTKRIGAEKTIALLHCQASDGFVSGYDVARAWELTLTTVRPKWKAKAPKKRLADLAG